MEEKNSEEVEKVVSEKKVVDLADFFTKKNSEEGVWHEPNINGKIGIEFKVIGAESNEAAQIFADYDKDMAKIDEIKDQDKKNEETRKAIANVTSKVVKGMRGVDGAEILIEGKPVKFDAANIYTIMYNSPSLANKIIRFSRNDTNFMKKK